MDQLAKAAEEIARLANEAVSVELDHWTELLTPDAAATMRLITERGDYGWTVSVAIGSDGSETLLSSVRVALAGDGRVRITAMRGEAG